MEKNNINDNLKQNKIEDSAAKFEQCNSYPLSEKTKQSIFRIVGISPEELTDMDLEDIHRHIETKIGKKLAFSTDAYIDGMRVPKKKKIFKILLKK